MTDNRAEEELNRQAHLLGFIGKSGNVSNLSIPKIENFAKKLSKKIGAKPAFSLFQAQVIYKSRVRTKKAQVIKKKFERGRATISREHGKELTQERQQSWQNRKRTQSLPTLTVGNLHHRQIGASYRLH